MYNREEKEREGLMRDVAFQVEIGAVVGDFEITNVDVYAVYGGSRVTQVPAGGNFEIHANYNIKNNAAGLTWWSTSMTVYNVTAGVPVASDNFGQHSGGTVRSAADAINAVMPSVNTTFRVKIWANQAANAGAPPQSDW